MYTGVHSDRESYSFELFDLPLDVPLVRKIHGLCIPVDSFDLRCESVTYFVINYVLSHPTHVTFLKTHTPPCPFK